MQVIDSEELKQKRKNALEQSEHFDCCSDYLACSKAGKCLWGAPPCAYRANLEKGAVFYGKTADGFSPERYQEICRTVAGLSPEARKAFDELIIVFQEYFRGTSNTIVRNQYIDELSAVGVFTFSPLGLRFLPEQDERWSAKKVRELVSGNAEDAAAFARAAERRKAELEPLRRQVKAASDRAEQKRWKEHLDAALKQTPGEDTKRFLREWLNREGAPLRDRLAEPYRIAAYVADGRQYGEAYYQDFLIGSYDSRVYRLSPYAEDGLLTDAYIKEEETRRAEMSHGLAGKG